MGTLTPEVSKRLEDAVARMPAFPKSVQKILELTRNINCAPKDIVGVIEKDPVVTVKILKVLNSAFYALPNKVTSVNRAVVFLGINTVKNLALSFASVGVLPKSNSAGFDMERYLRHSLITAGVARQIAATHADGRIDPMDCYIAGLLHDFGKVVFAQFMADEFKQALAASQENESRLHQAEQEVIGADHTVVGSMLAERWQFPEGLVECIRHHHDAEIPPNLFSECLYVADTLSKRIANPEAPLSGYDPTWRGKALGLSVDDIAASLGDLGRFASEADMFLQTSRE